MSSKYKTIKRIKINTSIYYHSKNFTDNGFFDIIFDKKKKEFQNKKTPIYIETDWNEIIIICHYGKKQRFKFDKELDEIIKLFDSNEYKNNIEILCCFPGIAKKKEKKFNKYIKLKTKKECGFILKKYKNERVLCFFKKEK
jgi:hypothetical protein